jgi:nitric oxide dioxygenase
MKEHYGKEMPPPVEAAWGEAMGFFAKILIDWEEKLYKEAEERSGGWRGLKVFTVAAIEDVATNTKAFTFVDPEYSGGYEFTPGQYLSVKCDVDNDGLTCPRHYTITSAPGEKFLQITVKKLDLGKVSSYLHEQVKVGDTVQLSPPFGIFCPPSNSKSAVLISAGVGATPMVNFMRHYEKHGNVALIAHIDANKDAYPFRALFKKSGKLMTHYTNCIGKPVAGSPGDINLDDFTNKIMDKVGVAHDFFVCGPPEFSRQVKAAVSARGARCHCENFGPQLSTNCPYVTDKCSFRH